MKKITTSIIFLFLLFGLTSCSQTPQEMIIGEWELVDGSEEVGYWDITEDEITVKSENGAPLSNHRYKMIKIEDTEDKYFKLEFTEGSNEEMSIFAGVFDISIEGYFEDKNTIIASTSIGSSTVADFKFIRVKKGESTSADSKNETSSSDEKSELYSMYGMKYSIPESWVEEAVDEDTKYYYPEAAMLMVAYTDLEGTLSDDETREYLINGFTSEFETFNLVSESKITVDDKTAYQYELNNVMSDQKFENSIVFFDYQDGIIALQMSTLSNSDKDYSNQFEEILNSIEFTN